MTTPFEHLATESLARIDGRISWSRCSPSAKSFTMYDMVGILRDSYNAEAAERQPYFRGWTSDDARVEKARALVASWDAVMNRESTPAAIYMTWQRHADMEAVAKGSRDGNSGQPGSPYYANLPERWGRNEFFPPVVHATRRGGEDPPSSDACASAVRMGERCKEQH